MASNPMQRKARNSFLLGVFITMIIAAIVIGFLLWKMYKDKQEKEIIESAKVTVYVLSQDVTSGTNVQISELRAVEVPQDAAPLTAITASNFATIVTENSLYKIDLPLGTIISSDMIVESDDVTANDTREQEFNMIVLPTYLEIDDYVDIRLRLPSGEDYIVVSKKRVIDSDEVTMWIKLSEDEILTLSNAIVEAYKIDGSELYATTYVEPGIQDAASVTYVPSVSVAQLINDNPNVVQIAKEELAKRYSSNLIKGRTDIINPTIGTVGEQAQANLTTGVSTSIESQKESRSNYIKELESAQLSTETVE